MRPGATKMDRPEWGAVNPHERRRLHDADEQQQRRCGHSASTDAANPRFYNDPTHERNGADAAIRTATSSASRRTVATRRDRPSSGTSSSSERASDGRRDERQRVRSHREQRPVEPGRTVVQPSGGLLWIQTDDGAYTDVTNTRILPRRTIGTQDPDAVSIPAMRRRTGCGVRPIACPRAAHRVEWRGIGHCARPRPARMNATGGR